MEATDRQIAESRLEGLYKPLMDILSTAPPYDDPPVDDQNAEIVIKEVDENEIYASPELLRAVNEFRYAFYNDRAKIHRENLDGKLVEIINSEYSMLKEKVGYGKISNGDSSIGGSSGELPDRVTLSWLRDNVPIKFWLWLVGILIATFVFGTSIGQVTLVRELYGNKQPTNLSDSGIDRFPRPQKVTLANGEINLPGQGFYLVDAEESSTPVELRRINGLKRGDQVILAAVSSKKPIVVKKSPYLKMSYLFHLNNKDDRIVFVCDGMNICSELSRSSNE